MKKFFLILYAIVMIITVFATIYFYRTQKSPEELSENQTVSTQDPGPLYAYSANGERGPLLDPIKTAISVDSTSGNALLTENTDYYLEYFTNDQTFNITLLGTNLRESRLKAEQDLLTRFQITEEQACSLSVHVGTIASVSQEFSGIELGLSFCSGRVDLPTNVTDPLEAGATTGVQPDVQL